MGLDRLITLHLAHPLLRLRTEPSNSRLRTPERRLPILMYHSISDDPEPGVGGYYRVCTSPQRFAEHMQGLADWGYRGVPLSEGLGWLNEAQPSPEVRDQKSERSDRTHLSATNLRERKLVALTFDDGFRDNLTEAFPVLQQHGFSATIYLPTAAISEAGDRRPFASRECLVWDEVQQLAVAGIEFGSHTVNHPKLRELDWPEIETELRDSKAELERRVGHRVDTFAYPFAFPQADASFVRRFRFLLEHVGYRSCVTTAIGRTRPTSDPLALPRLPANEIDDPRFLLAKLEGAYDWLGPIQTWAKNTRRHLRSR